MADGTLLDFMDVMDLSAVFGNALDNAIEYEVQIADPAKLWSRKAARRPESGSARSTMIWCFRSWYFRFIMSTLSWDIWYCW